MRNLLQFLMLTALLVHAGCLATVTRVNSEPEGAKVYLDGELIGTTPFVHHDRETTPVRHRLQIELEGFRIEEFYLDRYGARLPPTLMFRLRPLDDAGSQKAASPRSGDDEPAFPDAQAAENPRDERAEESPSALPAQGTLLGD